MLEARLLNSSGLGELAAISYRRALELDRARRDFILSELIKAPPTPIAQVAAWLPRAHRLAYYKQLITHRPERARRFLEGFKAQQLSGDPDIRAIWIRQLGRASRESLAGRVKSALMKRIKEQLDQGERSLVERTILSADLRALICYQQANQYTEEYSLEVEPPGALRIEISRSALFSKSVVFVRNRVPSVELNMAPPRRALLSDSVVFVSVAVPLFKIPPPLGEAWLPEIVTSVSVMFPALKMPPPTRENRATLDAPMPKP